MKQGTGNLEPGKRWRIALGAVVAAVALWLAARGTSLDALRAAMSSARIEWVFLAIASVILTVAAGVIRWRLLFFPDAHNRSWSTLAAASIVGQTLNIVLPIRLGEVARAGWVSRAERLPIGQVGGTIAVEKLADLVTTGVVVSVLLVLAAVPGWLAAPGRALIGTGAVAIAVMVLVSLRGKALAAAGDRLAGLLPAAIGTPLHRLFVTALEGTRVLESWRITSAVGILSVIVLMLAASTNYLMFFAFDLEVPAAAAVVLLIALQVGNTIVSVPGNVGVFQYVAVLTLGAYSVEPDVAFAYAVLLHIVALGPKILGGALLLPFAPRAAAG